MDKIGYFQSIYEAQFALGKKTGACLSAQYLALEAFLQRNPKWHYQWWPIVGITSEAWSTLQTRASSQSSNRVINSQGLIRAHLYDRVKRGRALFERDTPLPDAWHFYEARDATVLAVTEERNAVARCPWLPLNPEVLGQQGTGVPVITRKRFNALRNALSLLATPESAI
jgi:hypothetical protein